jgi:multicomponent Na+:H+ antiporter subunit D
VVIAVPSVLFGVFPALLLGAFPGDTGGFEPYATSELAKALAATVAGIVAFWVFRGPLARIHPVDVDRVLHPLAATGASAVAAGAVRLGSAATAAGTELTGRLGSLVGEDPATAETTLHAAMLALAATTAAALLLVAFA